ncbi:MAG: exo-alpha-sialidase [Verrucomicrobiae bacterium]|nr:exo-alpha-sialidase [Verrucomicrobiae bacterium]
MSIEWALKPWSDEFLSLNPSLLCPIGEALQRERERDFARELFVAGLAFPLPGSGSIQGIPARMSTPPTPYVVPCLLAAALFVWASTPASSAQEAFETFIAAATDANPRQSEGDILALKDGSLLAAWSDFYGGSEDNAAGRISAARSTDGGHTWSPKYTLQENTGKANVMSASLLRSQSGDILFFFLRKNALTDLKIYMRRSSDEAATWSEPVLVTPEDGYHVMNNARVIQLKSGRLLAPVSTSKEVWTKNDDFKTVMYFSDDDGRSWKRGRTMLSAPKRGAMEPGVVDMKDGRVLQIIRTQTGYIWHAYSEDGGDTWSEAQPWNITSPEAPATLVRLPDSGDWVLVRNPDVVWSNPEKTVLGANHGGMRTPLVAQLSRDEGKTWSKPVSIESDPAITFAYTSVTAQGDRVLLSYYHFPVGGKKLSLCFKSLPLTVFEK